MSDLSDWENALSDEEEKTAQDQKAIDLKKKELKKKEENERQKKENAAFDKLDPHSKKLKLKEMELKNDAQNTLDLFGVSPTKEVVVASSTIKIPKLQVYTLPEIAPAVSTITDSIDVKDKLQVEFYQTLFKELLSDVNYMAIREITSSLDAMANEKQRMEKGGKKKKKKAQVTVEKNIDMREFEDFI